MTTTLEGRKPRRGTSAAWTSADTVLAEGELGYETDTGKFKLGDGATAWTSLDYIDSSIEAGSLLATGATDGHVLTADGAGGSGWEAIPASSMDDLTDADTTTAAPAVGDALVFDGTNWVPDSGTYVGAAGGEIETGTGQQVVGLDISHSADQGVSSDYRALVIHNYTDSEAVRIDNVGSGAVLSLRNAQNATKRGDKASTYVGTGKFLSLSAHDDAAGFAREPFFIDNTGKLVWTGATPTAASGGIARLLSNKADDGGYAYSFDTTNDHLNVMNLGGVVELRNDVSLTRAVWRSTPARTNGLFLDTSAGPLLLGATTLVRMNKALTLKSFTTAGRPTGSGREEGSCIWDSTLKQPIWFDGTNWIDASGTAV